MLVRSQVLFFFILQYVSRAIVLTSFDDATRSFEERQRTKKLLAGDQLASFFKQQVPMGIPLGPWLAFLDGISMGISIVMGVPE